MKGHMGALILSSALLMLCIQVPVVLVEQITGMWSVMEKAMEEYISILSNFSYANFDFTAINDWAMEYSDQLRFSVASFVFILLVPGPLTLGLSQIWLRVLRRNEIYTDMIFSGFSDFFRVVVMDTLRRVLIILWSFLFIIPGIIAWYRYSQAFFIMVDNPGMKPFDALALSKYYMQQNKGSRFLLDLTFIGWLVASIVAFYVIQIVVFSIIISGGNEIGLFTQALVSVILSSIVFAPLFAYRGVTSAEYYHRVICKDPQSFKNPPALTSD